MCHLKTHIFAQRRETAHKTTVQQLTYVYYILYTEDKHFTLSQGIIPLDGGIFASGIGFCGASGTLNIGGLYKIIADTTHTDKH